MPTLVNLSPQKAKKFYGVVYPRNLWWVKLVNEIYCNFRNWLKQKPMRNYVYRTKAVEAEIQKNGFKRTFHRNMGGWQAAVFSR